MKIKNYLRRVVPTSLRTLRFKLMPVSMERFRAEAKKNAALIEHTAYLQTQLDTLTRLMQFDYVHAGRGQLEKFNLQAKALVFDKKIALPYQARDTFPSKLETRDFFLSGAENIITKPIIRSNVYLLRQRLQSIYENPHPNIMAIHDVFEDMIFAEFIDGMVLSNKRVGCPSHWRMSFLEKNGNVVDFKKIVDAVKHLHSLGLAHTDITSYNIIVSQNPECQPKLIDLWSLAELNDETESLDNFQLKSLHAELKNDFPGKVL